MRGDLSRECPSLDAATKAYEVCMVARPQEDQRGPKQTVAAVGTNLSPPLSSSDDNPPAGEEVEEMVAEEKSSAEKE